MEVRKEGSSGRKREKNGRITKRGNYTEQKEKQCWKLGLCSTAYCEFPKRKGLARSGRWWKVDIGWQDVPLGLLATLDTR